MPPRRLGKHAPPPPDDLRCRRSDGKHWRCPEPSMDGLALCIYHHRRSYQVPDSSPGHDSPPVTVTPVSDGQKPWKLRIKKPSQPNSAPVIRNPKPPPSPTTSDEAEAEAGAEIKAEAEIENETPKFLPTVLALAHSSEGRKRRGRKSNPQMETPPPIVKDNNSDEIINININNNNNINNTATTTTKTSAQRCKRSDGRGWQCKARALPGEPYCDHHYQKAKIQRDMKLSQSRSGFKKKRKAADVAAAMAKRRKEMMTSLNGEETAEQMTRELPKGLMTISSSVKSGGAGGLVNKGGDFTVDKKLGFEAVPVMVRPLRSKNPQPMPVGPVKRLPLGGKSKKKDKEKKKACHRCGEAKAGPVVRCKNCMRRYFCSKCIRLWYPGMSKVEINNCCPVCRNCCTCDICARLNQNKNDYDEDNAIDVPVQSVSVSVQEKIANGGEARVINIKFANCPFSQLLPVIKKLTVEQLDELEIEAHKQGKRMSSALVQVLEQNRDEQLNCNYCKGSIVEILLSCSNCNYKLCLTCSQKIRKEESKFENSNFIICEGDSCKSNFHSCDILCPTKELQGCEGEGKLGLVYSFPIGRTESHVIGGQETKSSLVSCKTNGHLNNSSEAQIATPSGFV